MKNLKIVLFTVMTLGLTLTSCSDDDNKSNTDASIVGKWTYSKEGEIVDGKEVLNDYEHTTGCSKDFVEFTATAVTDVYYSGSDCTENKDQSTYVKNGNSIVTMFDGEPQTLEIITLTSTTLKVKSSYLFEGTEYTDVAEYTR